MKSIAILLFDQVEVLDFAGPFEVFSIAGQRNVGEPFRVFTVAEKKSIAAKNNLIVQPTYLLDECPPCDIFLVPGGGGYHPDGKPFGTRYEMDNPTLLTWIRARIEKAELVLSVCSGALILAKAGLLENKEATTHFMAVDLLKSIAPTTKVSPEKVATTNYVNPVVAMFLGWSLNNEQVTTRSLIAAAIMLTGVFFINANFGKKQA